jgi:putative ABC transport system substrate-binding protein
LAPFVAIGCPGLFRSDGTILRGKVSRMRRREFIAGLGSAAAWPVVTRAQPGDRMRRIGVFMPGNENDPVWKPRLSAFTQALADLGWVDGRNVRMDFRWAGGDSNRIPALAQELVGLRPDIILANGNLATVAVQRETRTIPIVFATLTDPIANLHSKLISCLRYTPR